MPKRSKAGNMVHLTREIAAGQMMHLTSHLVPGAPPLRRESLRQVVWELIDEANGRGMQIVAATIMDEHVHLAVIPASREALLGRHRLLRSVFGNIRALRIELLIEMALRPMPFVPWMERIQRKLPGL